MQFLWKCKRKFVVTQVAKNRIRLIYDFLKDNRAWECPIGHMVPREPACECKGDASHVALGAINSAIKAIIFIPYKQELYNRMKAGKTHINVMELMILFLGYIMFLHKYKLTPQQFPPEPYLKLWGDSMSANKWFRTFSTASLMATKALELFAEYFQYSPVCPITEHIPGRLNIEADNISRPNKHFSPPREYIYDVNYKTLLKQVCRKHKKIENWDVFLPSKDLLWDISCVVYSASLPEGLKRRSSLGRFVPVASIFSGSATDINYSTCFL